MPFLVNYIPKKATDLLSTSKKKADYMRGQICNHINEMLGMYLQFNHL
jgi:hypothetical protein